MNAHDINAQLSVSLLIDLLSASVRGKPVYRDFGVSDQTFELLKELNNGEMVQVTATPILQLHINDNLLNQGIQRVLQGRARHKLINDAIRLGASREIMQDFASISHNQFNRQRHKLGLSEAPRRRPSKIKSDDYYRLSALHSRYGQDNSLDSKIDQLRCLVYLAEQSAIDINRIYQHFWRDNEQHTKELFGKTEHRK